MLKSATLGPVFIYLMYVLLYSVRNNTHVPTRISKYSLYKYKYCIEIKNPLCVVHVCVITNTMYVVKLKCTCYPGTTCTNLYESTVQVVIYN